MSTTFKVPVDYHNTGTVPDSSKIVNITYFDGLGRPIQKIAHRQSDGGNDIITHIGYDSYGRQDKEYLSYTNQSASMDFVTAALGETEVYYSTPDPMVNRNPNQESTDYPFSQTFFEKSPLNRARKVSAPGLPWKGNETDDNDATVKKLYQSNRVEEVRHFKAATVWNGNHQNNQGFYEIALEGRTTYYAPNTLYKTITRDENWTADSQQRHSVEEFKDKDGRIVLKRTFGEELVLNDVTVAVAHETYYVYDLYGNLTYVIPPLVNTNENIDANVLNNLCYQYKYDAKNRLVEKKLPGKQWEFIVYDKFDRVAATGPSLAPFIDHINSNKFGWLIIKYDAFNRPVLTGFKFAGDSPVSNDRVGLQGDYDTQNGDLNEVPVTMATNIEGIDIFYSSSAFPQSEYHVLTVNYYDDYRFTDSANFPEHIEEQPVYFDNNSLKPKGLPTGNLVRILEQSDQYRHESSYMLYDTKARVIRTRKNNHLGGFTINDKKYDFIGKTLKSTVEHKRLAGGTATVMKDFFKYTGQDRLKLHTHVFNSHAPELLANNVYDALGKLVTSYVGGSNVSGEPVGYQKVDFQYNIRGWLKSINNPIKLNIVNEIPDLFAMDLKYNEPQAMQPLYNGNISETNWVTASDNVPRYYGFSYDSLNRLTDALYQKTDVATAANSYGEQASYDKNGNILTLMRNGELDDSAMVFNIDDLEYSYAEKSNRLVKVNDLTDHPKGFKDDMADTDDANDDYEYDANGNMVSDANKQINQIFYNHLNLPVRIEFSGSDRKIEYIYNALGQKMHKDVLNDSVFHQTDYLDSFQYLDGILRFYPTAAGYINNTHSGGYDFLNYVFSYKDHLGNVRLNYAKNPKDETIHIMEENNYYPFGLKHNAYNYTYEQYRFDSQHGLGIEEVQIDEKANKYKYNGKEYQDELGLNLYDYGARNYDPALGRWLNIDPLAESSRRWSPYNYCYNNPVVFVDPDGMFPEQWEQHKNQNSFARGKRSWSDLALEMATDEADKADEIKDLIDGFVESIKVDKELKERFKIGNLDPNGKPDLSLNGALNLNKNVEGLEQVYVDGGKPNIRFDLKSKNFAGLTEPGDVNLNPKKIKSNLMFAALLFHEYRHAWQYESGYYDLWRVNYPKTLWSDGYEDVMERDAYWFQIQMGGKDFLRAEMNYADYVKKTKYLILPYNSIRKL